MNLIAVNNISILLFFFSSQKFPRLDPSKTLVFLENLVQLVGILVHHLDVGKVEILCYLVECLVTAIATQIDNEENSALKWAEIPKEMSSFFKQQRDLVEKFIDSKLSFHLGYSQIIPWEQELQVTQ